MGEVFVGSTHAEPGIERMWASAGLHRYDRHAHDQFSLIVVTEGRKRFRVGRAEQVAQAGDVILVAPGDSHDCEPIGAEGWAHCCWYLSSDFVGKILNDSRCATDPQIRSGIQSQPDTAGRLSRLHLTTRHGDRNSNVAESHALRSVFDQFRDRTHDKDESISAAARHRASRYESILRSEDPGGLNLSRLANIGGVSKYQVIRDVNAAFGMSPGRLLRDFRLRHSKLLLQTDLDLTQISLDLGFADLSHFVRSFRSAYGMPPGRYRKQIRGVRSSF